MLDQPVPREIEAARYKRRRPNKRVLLAWIATLLVGVVAAGWAVPKWLKSGSSDNGNQNVVDANVVTDAPSANGSAQPDNLGLGEAPVGAAENPVDVNALQTPMTAPTDKATQTESAVQEAATAGQEADRLAAEEAARASADQAAEAAAAQKATELAEEQAAAEQAARQARADRLKRAREQRRRLNAALVQAEEDLDRSELDKARVSLGQASLVDADDARVLALQERLQIAIIDKAIPVSDADFDTTIGRFDALRRALQTGDIEKMDQLTVNSNQNKLFEQLIRNFASLDIRIDRIRVRNADKSITANLRIERMVRDNGDRATPSPAYRERTISSKRREGEWSLINW